MSKKTLIPVLGDQDPDQSVLLMMEVEAEATSHLVQDGFANSETAPDQCESLSGTVINQSFAEKPHKRWIPHPMRYSLDGWNTNR